MEKGYTSRVKKEMLSSISNSRVFQTEAIARAIVGLPFVDGTGCLVLNLMLMQVDYPPINVKYSYRKRYYESFDTYYRDNS